MSLLLLCPTEYEFIFPMDDDFGGPFTDERSMKTVELRSKCVVELSRRVLSKRVGATTWTKYNIVKIKGPNEGSVKKCNKLLERLSPNYISRKEYDSERIPVIYTSEFFPDNTNVIGNSQRLGANLDKFQGLNLYSRYKTKNRYPLTIGKDNTPWKVFESQVNGIHIPCQKKTLNIVTFLQSDYVTSERPISHNINRTLPKLKNSIKGIVSKSKEMIDIFCASEHITNISAKKSNKDEPSTSLSCKNNYVPNDSHVRRSIRKSDEKKHETYNQKANIKKKTNESFAPMENILEKIQSTSVKKGAEDASIYSEESRKASSSSESLQDDDDDSDEKQMLDT